MTGTCYLISRTYTKDSNLNLVPTETRREIICEERSLSSSEFHNAKRDGLSPEIEIVTAKVNYQGEKILEYNGTRYGIYRTYVRGDSIELYCEIKAGI